MLSLDYDGCVSYGRTVASDVLERLGDSCVASFGEFAGLDFFIHRKWLVDDGSYVGHCSAEVSCELEISIEAAVMLSLKDPGEPPKISADLMHFVHGRRVGVTEWQGDSVSSFLFCSDRGWFANGDGLGDDGGWETVFRRRFLKRGEVIVERDGWCSDA